MHSPPVLALALTAMCPDIPSSFFQCDASDTALFLPVSSLVTVCAGLDDRLRDWKALVQSEVWQSVYTTPMNTHSITHLLTSPRNTHRPPASVMIVSDHAELLAPLGEALLASVWPYECRCLHTRHSHPTAEV